MALHTKPWFQLLATFVVGVALGSWQFLSAPSSSNGNKAFSLLKVAPSTSAVDKSVLKNSANIAQLLVFNQSFHGDLVSSESQQPAKVTSYATSIKTGIGSHAFSLINRTANPQSINLRFNNWLPSGLTWHLWDIGNDYSTQDTSWVDLNNGNFILSPYSVNLFIEKN